MISRSGYPTDELIEQLRTMEDSDGVLRLAAEAVNATGYGSAWEEDDMLKVATRGWSGCEDIVVALNANVFAMVRWESSHRGGLHVFKLGGTP